MLSSLTTKLAMKKLGIPSDPFKDFANPFQGPSTTDTSPRKLRKNPPADYDPDADDAGAGAGWPAWMTVKSLPLSVQPWLTPPAPAVPVAAECPRVGDLAPIDRGRKLVLGGMNGGGQRKRTLVVFLRCVGCAFAKKTFLALRTLANRYPSELNCIAVSHSSPAATAKWLDLLGGAWAVQVVVDEERSVYAAWGLGLGSVWYVLNPATQVQSWKEKGWLGASVAGHIEKKGLAGGGAGGGARHNEEKDKEGEDGEGGPTTVMGNKWQQAGAWAVDERGTIIWGGKAAKADDVLDLDACVKALGIR